MELNLQGARRAGWEATCLGDFEPFVTSGSRGWAEHYSEYGDAFLRITNLSRESIYIDLGDLKFVRLPPDDREGIRTALRQGDLLISITADIGIVGLIDERVPSPAYINQHIALVRVEPSRADARFLAYYLAAESAQRRFRSATDQGAKAGMNLDAVRHIPVVMPPLAEQRAVAVALSDVDALLAALDHVIAKKRDLKQAAMHQLLTGKTRLPGFRSAWSHRRLAELGAFAKGKGIQKDDVRSEGIPCIRYGEIYTHHNDVVRTFHSFISPSVANESFRLQTGDIIFAGSGETAEEIGKCVAFVDGCEAYVGGDTVILRPVGQDPVFLGYLLNMPVVATKKARLGQGDAVVHISARNLAALSVQVPDGPEQHAIGEVIADMDTEIVTLERRRDKTRRLKQGVMQELLTGRTRLL